MHSNSENRWTMQFNVETKKKKCNEINVFVVVVVEKVEHYGKKSGKCGKKWIYKIIALTDFERICQKYSDHCVIYHIWAYLHITQATRQSQRKHRWTSATKRKQQNEKKKKKKKQLSSRTAIHISCFVQWRRQHHLYVCRLYYSLIAEHNANENWGHKSHSNGEFSISKLYRKREPKATENMYEIERKLQREKSKKKINVRNRMNWKWIFYSQLNRIAILKMANTQRSHTFTAYTKIHAFRIAITSMNG